MSPAPDQMDDKLVEGLTSSWQPPALSLAWERAYPGVVAGEGVVARHLPPGPLRLSPPPPPSEGSFPGFASSACR